MAGAFPERAVEELRRLHFLIAVVLIDAAHVLFDDLPEGPAAGMPEDHARRFVLDVEEVEFLAEAAMVALFRFFEHVEVGGLFVLRGPGRAVDALQHFVLAVAAPVGARHLHELVDLELARRRHVRTAAEVDEVALTIERNRFAFGDGFDQFGLVLFTHVEEELHGFVARHFDAFDRKVALDDFVHAGFDLLQVFGREGTFEGEVVVEAVFNGRPDRHLRRREEFLDGLGHQVRRRVADEFETFGIAPGHDGDFGVLVDHMGEVDETAVHTAGESGLRKAHADVLGDVEYARSIFKFTLRTVGKSNRNHDFPR